MRTLKMLFDAYLLTMAIAGALTTIGGIIAGLWPDKKEEIVWGNRIKPAK